MEYISLPRYDTDTIRERGSLLTTPTTTSRLTVSGQPLITTSKIVSGIWRQPETIKKVLPLKAETPLPRKVELAMGTEAPVTCMGLSL